ncbi:MAG: hypothetical protein JXO22_03210 [Phycisphaerae bacterium]|nr:hypothetical protein [Phycisphaerae bacterium]
MIRFGVTLLSLLLLGTGSGCTMLTRFANDPGGAEFGKTFYVGGAGPVGLVVGTESVPRGLRQAGYLGAIEVYGWQSWVGGTLRDQMDAYRNRREASRLADRITAYCDQHPGRPVNIIALSAGTGVVSWALAALPADVSVQSVVFLGSSLSREYDLAPSLAHVSGYLWSFYSPTDPILRYAVPITGSVDREFVWGGVAGLYGFAPPEDASNDVRALYKERLRNLPWRQAYARAGYEGRHTDGVKAEFVAAHMYPLLITRRQTPESLDSTPSKEAPNPAQAVPTSQTTTESSGGSVDIEPKRDLR